MTRRRFFAPPDAFDFHARQVSLSADEARHLREVLRLKVGDQVSVFDGVGNEYTAVVHKTLRDSALLEIGDQIAPASQESPLKLTLAVALLKGDKFDLLVQKATELGVATIVPVITRFADVRLRDDSDAARRVTRWQRIALEAAKQSGRAAVPLIESPTDVQLVLAGDTADAGLRVMFAERGGGPLSELPATIPAQSAVVLTGSEGGWAGEEIDQAVEHGWKVVTLGGRILRAETAAIVVTGLIQHLYGDLR